MANEVAKRTEMHLVPPTKFHIVVDLNTSLVWGPFNTLDEAKYKAAEVAAGQRGPKPVGVFQYVGGVENERKPIFWTDAGE